MNYLDFLPMELLHEIAQDSEPAYKALLAHPRFARAVTPGKRIDYMVGFGHDIRVRKDTITWYRNSYIHRHNGPAIIRHDEIECPPCIVVTEIWYRNGIEHREDGPALIRSNGQEEWYRDDVPPLIYMSDEQRWYHGGVLHREDGPALIHYTGRKAWYHNGDLHCDNGPAIIYASGAKEWWVRGVFIRREYPSEL